MGAAAALLRLISGTRRDPDVVICDPGRDHYWLGNSTFGGGIHVDRQFSEPQEPAYVSGQVLSRMRRDDASLRPSAAAQAHMESCTACQELARRLAQAVALLRRAQERTSQNGRLELGH